MELPHPDQSRAEARESTPSGPAQQSTGHSCPSTGAVTRALPPADAAPAAPSVQWLLLARIVRPHGRHGEVVAEILTDFPERFHARPRLRLIPPPRIGAAPRDIGLENFWFLRSRIVLKLQGVDTIGAAEGVRGYDLAIPASERAPLEAGTWYAADLIGCTLVDLNGAGAAVGQIVDIDRGSSSTDLLVVRKTGAQSSAGDLLIPFVNEYLVRVDPSARRVEMRLPEGLLEINAPLTEEEKRRPSEG